MIEIQLFECERVCVCLCVCVSECMRVCLRVQCDYMGECIGKTRNRNTDDTEFVDMDRVYEAHSRNEI